MTRLDRRLLFTTGAAAALLAATGVSAHVTPKRGGRLVAALSGADRSDTWAQPHGVFMQAARSAVFETLTEIAADGTLHGDIAKSWASADGGVTWDFELHGDVVFHDSHPLHVADITALFDRHAALGAVDVEPTGPSTFRVTLATANPSLPYLLADPAYVVLPAEADRQTAGIGTGPYRVQKFHAGRQFIGRRVTAHRKDGQAGWFDEVELVSIPSDTIRAEAFRDTSVDLADVTALDAFTDPTDFQMLPTDHAPQQIARKTVGVPTTIGTAWPLDNMRMSTRWWMV